jgi:RNA polymerase sigma-70 factor (ECF subfamily)
MVIDDTLAMGMVRSGTEDAFASIIERYQMPIFRYLYRLTSNYQLAQDLTQDTFVQAYESILKTKAELQLKAWLYKIATNNAYKHFRRKRLVFFIDLDSSEDIPSLSEKDDPETIGDRVAMQEALNLVPLNERCCIVLHIVDGLKYKEIAETLGISEDAVRMRVARGKQIIRKHLEIGG